MSRAGQVRPPQRHRGCRRRLRIISAMLRNPAIDCTYFPSLRVSPVAVSWPAAGAYYQIYNRRPEAETVSRIIAHGYDMCTIVCLHAFSKKNSTTFSSASDCTLTTGLIQTALTCALNGLLALRGLQSDGVGTDLHNTYRFHQPTASLSFEHRQLAPTAPYRPPYLARGHVQTRKDTIEMLLSAPGSLSTP